MGRSRRRGSASAVLSLARPGNHRSKRGRRIPSRVRGLTGAGARLRRLLRLLAFGKALADHSVHRGLGQASPQFAQPIVLPAKPGELHRRVPGQNGGPAGVLGHNASPAFRPPSRPRQLRSIDGAIPNSPAICVNGRPLLTSSATASPLNSSVN